MRNLTKADEVKQFLANHAAPPEIELVGGPFDGLTLSPETIFVDAIFPTSPAIVEDLVRMHDWGNDFDSITSLSHYQLNVVNESLHYQFQGQLSPRKRFDLEKEDWQMNASISSRESSSAQNGDQPTPASLGWNERWANLLDTQFVIPGTRIRFGADFLLGLLPGLGDAVSLGFSGILVAAMARQGASPLLLVRMLINILLDAVVGAIPVLGNLFDLFYRANSRNVKLMRQHYREGKHRGSVWPLVIGVLAVTATGLVLLGWLLMVIFRAIWPDAAG